jgi:predicted MFS family arabinose efflux permease
MFLSFVGFSASQFHGYLFQRLGFSPFHIGFLLFTGYGAGIVAPLIQVRSIRWLRGPRLPLLIVLSGAGVGLMVLPHLPHFPVLAVVFFLTLFCTMSTHPLTTACVLEVTRSRGESMFFIIRTLGTVGFLAGCLVSFFRPDPVFLPWLYLGFGVAFLAAMASVVFGLKPTDPSQAPEDILVVPHPKGVPGFRRAFRLLSAPRPRRLLMALGLMNFANSMAILVQGNYLVNRFEGGQSSISMAWIISTATEIPLMLFCVFLVRRFNLQVVIAFGLLGTAVKLVTLGLADSRWVYFLGLTAHGCFYSGALVGFNLYLDRHFRVADRPVLQALGALFFQGLPSACGGLCAGLLWHFSGIRSVYWAAALVAVATALYTVFRLPRFPVKRAG